LLGAAKAGSAGSTSTCLRQQRREIAAGQLARQRLLDYVADHALAFRAEHVERIGRHRAIGQGLQRQEPDLRPVAVGKHHLVFAGDGRDRRGHHAQHVGALQIGRRRLAPAKQRVAAERDHHPHQRVPLPAPRSRKSSITAASRGSPASAKA